MALLHRIQFWLNKVTTVNPTFTTAYTVGAGKRIVLKTVTVRNLDSGAARTVYLEVNGLLVWSKSLGAGGGSTDFFELDTDIVLHPADVISLATSGGTAGVMVTLSGSIYTI